MAEKTPYLQLALNFNNESVEEIVAVLAGLVSTVADSWHGVINLPEVVQSNFRFPAGHPLATDVVKIAEKLTQAPYCPQKAGNLRSLTFLTALSVLRANAGIVNGDRLIKEELEKVIDSWKRNEDCAMRYLARNLKL